jgi:hypothetical protein
MNKGIALSKGDFLYFLNSGDYLVGNVLGKVNFAPVFLPIKYKSFFNKIKHQNVKPHFLGLPVGHQGIIFENKNILYDLKYKYASDYDFFLKHGYKSNIKKLDCDGYVYYDNQGLSKINSLIRDHEISQIIFEKFGFIPFTVFFHLQKLKSIIKFIYQKDR